MPARILDLFVEFRNRTNGLPTPVGAGLPGALTYFGIDGVTATEKKELQQAIGNGTWPGRFGPAEILDYCESDIVALTRLLPAMLPGIDLPRALLRGRYMVAASAMEFAGVPIDLSTLELLRANWTRIQDRLIAEIDTDYGVFDGRTFKADRFAARLIAANIPWPRLATGHLALDDDTFRQMSHPRRHGGSVARGPAGLRNRHRCEIGGLSRSIYGRTRPGHVGPRVRPGRRRRAEGKEDGAMRVKRDVFDNLETLRQPDGMVTEARVATRKERKRRETLVQTPWKTVDKMRGVNHTWWILMYLQHLHWRNKGNPIKLANGMLGLDGVPREAKRRAIRELERRGLITVERHPRKSPVIRLTDAPSQK
jgi:hypothetical protein